MSQLALLAKVRLFFSELPLISLTLSCPVSRIGREVVLWFLSSFPFIFFSFHRNFMSLEDFILFFLCDLFHRAFHHLSSLVSWTDVAGSEGHDELVTVQGHFRHGGGWGKRARLVDATRG